jgi:hypothetical protein
MSFRKVAVASVPIPGMTPRGADPGRSSYARTAAAPASDSAGRSSLRELIPSLP